MNVIHDDAIMGTSHAIDADVARSHSLYC